MSMLSLQTNHSQEPAERSEDMELRNALPKVIATYPDGTIVVRVEDVEKVRRVMVDTGHYCKAFYEVPCEFYEEASDESELPVQ